MRLNTTDTLTVKSHYNLMTVKLIHLRLNYATGVVDTCTCT